MPSTSKIAPATSVDLTSYLNKILDVEDRPLFEEAVVAASSGILRSAYLIIWISCAESLKRRFREAQKRDGVARKIVGDITDKESNHKSVDKFVLDKSKEYGFINDSEHTILYHVYQMRCIYGHPYETAPTPEQVSHAASSVVDFVLSKPVKLKHGFCKQLIKELTEEPNYLDDQRRAVTTFAGEIIHRIDNSVYSWLLDTYVEKLEKIANDPSMSIYFKRGEWFCQTLLRKIGVDVYSHAEWHDRVIHFSKTLLRVCSSKSIFRNIGINAQDALVGAALAESTSNPAILSHIDRLALEGELSERQYKRLATHVKSLKIADLCSSGLSTMTCYDKLIASMKVRDWYTQNPAVDLIVSNGPGQAADLNKDQQIVLGRNILQACNGGSRSACTFLENLAEAPSAWPEAVVQGIVLEVFVNEENILRFKDRPLDTVLTVLEHIKNSWRLRIVLAVSRAITSSTPQERLKKDDVEDVINDLNGHTWTNMLRKALQAKAESLPARRA